jgi:hypothetical protein
MTINYPSPFYKKIDLKQENYCILNEIIAFSS